VTGLSVNSSNRTALRHLAQRPAARCGVEQTVAGEERDRAFWRGAWQAPVAQELQPGVIWSKSVAHAVIKQSPCRGERRSRDWDEAVRTRPPGLQAGTAPGHAGLEVQDKAQCCKSGGVPTVPDDGGGFR
jgi:hypothetical protein